MLAESLQLGIDRARLWDTSWAGVIFLVSVTAALAALTRWAGRAAPMGQTQGLRWPLHPNAAAYWWNAAVPLAVLALAGAALAAVLAEGITDPLPYLPLLNPVDLSVALALAALALWRRMVASAAHPPTGAEPLLGGIGAVESGQHQLMASQQALASGRQRADPIRCRLGQPVELLLQAGKGLGLLATQGRQVAMRHRLLAPEGLAGQPADQQVQIDHRLVARLPLDGTAHLGEMAAPELHRILHQHHTRQQQQRAHQHGLAGQAQVAQQADAGAPQTGGLLGQPAACARDTLGKRDDAAGDGLLDSGGRFCGGGHVVPRRARARGRAAALSARAARG